MSCILISLHSGWWEYELFPSLCAFWELFGLFSVGSFSSLMHFLLCTHRQTLSQRLKEQFCRSLECSLYEAPSSPVLCPANFTILVSPNADLCSLNSVRSLSSFLFLVSPLWPGICLQRVSWGNCRSHFICFPSLRDHSPTLPVVHCLKTIVSYNQFSFLTVYRKEDILVGFPG